MSRNSRGCVVRVRAEEEGEDNRRTLSSKPPARDLKSLDPPWGYGGCPPLGKPRTVNRFLLYTIKQKTVRVQKMSYTYGAFAGDVRTAVSLIATSSMLLYNNKREPRLPFCYFLYAHL